MTNRWHALSLLLITCWLSAASVVAQPPSPDDSAPPRPGGLNLPGEFPDLFGQEDGGPKVFLNARFEVEEGTQNGRLHVTAEPAPGWHIYSISQKPGGPLPTKLKVAGSQQVKLAGPFTPDHPPHVKLSDVFFKDIANQKDPIEEESHDKAVTWTAPLELVKDADPKSLTITVNYEGQACKESCIPIEEKLSATFAGYYTVAKPTGEFTAESGHVTWKAHVEPKVVAPGGKVKLVFTATPTEPYHVYAYATRNTKKGFAPTLIALRPLPEGWQPSAALTDAAIVTKPAPTPTSSEITYHKGPVTWTIEVDVPASAEVGKVDLGGAIGFQTCTDETCDMPAGTAFSVTVPVAKQSQQGKALVAFSPANYDDAEKLAADNAPSLALPEPAEFSASALLTAMGFALLGGLILNVMPCVLPVIPLKLLSFVEQAGQNRAKLMTYNLVYAAGTIAVFMILAAVGIVFGLGWGEQFAVTEFQIVLTLFMFAMTLSLLGLWEIPLPGAIGAGETVGNEKSSSLTGAFSKGFMTTIYATPCSGPFLGIAIGATIGFPAYATLLVFLAAGLGFASPYIVFGLLMANSPGITKFIPKPGVWMEHVKQGLGFILLIVVLYYLCLIDTEYRIATLFAAIGVAFGCWIIGKVPSYAETRTKLSAWTGAAVSIAALCWIAFTYMGPTSAHGLLPWKPYSPEALAQAQAEGKTVMIDFTASWCPNCHWNYRTAINTEAVHEVVQKNDVVTLLADWSDRGEVVKRKLLELNSKTIPLLAVYPASGGEPIVLRDVVIQSQVVKALEEAGPSKGKEDEDSGTSTAMLERTSH